MVHILYAYIMYAVALYLVYSMRVLRIILVFFICKLLYTTLIFIYHSCNTMSIYYCSCEVLIDTFTDKSPKLSVIEATIMVRAGIRVYIDVCIPYTIMCVYAYFCAYTIYTHCLYILYILSLYV